MSCPTAELLGRQGRTVKELVSSTDDRFRLVVATAVNQKKTAGWAKAVVFEKRDLAELLALRERPPDVLFGDVPDPHQQLSSHVNREAEPSKALESTAVADGDVLIVHPAIRLLNARLTKVM